MKRMKKLGLAVCAVAVLAFVVPQAIAALSITRRANLGAQRLVTVSSTGGISSTGGTTFVPLSGASTTISVPGGQTARIVARFAGESRCMGGAAGDWCAIRILTDGVEMLPVRGITQMFDSAGASNDGIESHSIDRTTSDVLSSGSHTVTVEWRVSSSSTDFTFAGWHLAVELWRVS
jgi:hypothetical protein